MAIDAQGVIGAFARAAEIHREREQEPARKPTIVISRSMGSGGNQIARMLAERLGLELYGSEILDAVAKQAKVNRSLMANLNEILGAPGNAWLYATVFGQSVSRDDYLHHLVTTVRGLHKLGGVILGRGAFIVLEGRDALRVRITGSADACARRVAEEDGISLEEARRKVIESNRKRGKFVWDLFRRRLNDPTNFEVVVNTDRFEDFTPAVELIVMALRASGLDRPVELHAKI